MGPDTYQSGEPRPARRPVLGRLNLRVALFGAVILFALGWPVYTYLSESLSNGIRDRGAYKELNLKKLGEFTLDPMQPTVADVPAPYRALDGQRISIEGVVLILREGTDEHMTQWVLGFKTSPERHLRVQERVFCTASPGKSFRYPTGNVRLTGTFHVSLKQATLPGGGLGSPEEVYQLDVDSVEPL